MKKERGITLVALVVTIVVLLILAAVTLNLVLGNNGIITKAKDGAKEHQQVTINEEIAMNETVDYMENNSNKKTYTVSYQWGKTTWNDGGEQFAIPSGIELPQSKKYKEGETVVLPTMPQTSDMININDPTDTFKNCYLVGFTTASEKVFHASFDEINFIDGNTYKMPSNDVTIYIYYMWQVM